MSEANEPSSWGPLCQRVPCGTWSVAGVPSWVPQAMHSTRWTGTGPRSGDSSGPLGGTPSNSFQDGCVCLTGATSHCAAEPLKGAEDSWVPPFYFIPLV